jgi:signal transduction histidine kinase
VVRRASQLEALHTAVQGITSALQVRTLLERLLPQLAQATGATSLSVELVEPAGLHVSAQNPEAAKRRSAAPGPFGDAEEWREVEWAFPLVVQQRDIGLITARTLASGNTKTDDEQLLKIVASQVAIAVENARLYEGVTRKMDELHETQAQLIQAAKLAAIGEMAAQVAHEINNPLTSVLGFASLLVEQLPADSALQADAGLIMTEASRARDIVRDLLDFSRQRPFYPQSTELNGVLRQAVGLVRLQGVMASTIDEQYGDDLPSVQVDPARMKQVFLNIINNAVQAMPGGGALIVRTAATDADVVVSFTDNGPGIEPEHLQRIFEPFFTTKAEVNGTGLGLAVSVGIVRQHGGTIDVVSERGKGSTFTVRIPRQTREASGTAAV